MFEVFNKCQYPNLSAEIKIHRYGLHVFAAHGNITQELLSAFLDGEEKVTREEARGMISVGNSGRNISVSPDYLFSPRFGYYDMKKKKHRHKVLMVYQRCDKVRQSVDIQRLYNEGLIRFSDYKRLTEKANLISTVARAEQTRYIGRVLINDALEYMAELEYIAESASRKAAERYTPPPRGISKQLVTTNAM